MDWSRYKAALFDLDGMLIDTEKYYIKCWKAAADFWGYPMEMDRVYSLRSTDHQLATEKFTKWYGDADAYAKVRAKRQELMAELLKGEKVEAKPGVKEITDYLKQQGIKYAVVTASKVEVAEKYMKEAGIRDYFDIIISARDLKRGKPFPYVYEYAVDYLGLKPEECVAFEDSLNGLMSAKGAGCHTVMIPDLTPFNEEVAPYVDDCYDSLKDLVK